MGSHLIGETGFRQDESAIRSTRWKGRDARHRCHQGKKQGATGITPEHYFPVFPALTRSILRSRCAARGFEHFRPGPTRSSLPLPGGQLLGTEQGAAGNYARPRPERRSPMTTTGTGKLTPAQLETTTPGRYSDGKGLSLYIRPTGARSWSYQYRVGARVKELGLGAAAGAGREGLTLDQARAAAQRHRDTRAAGADPLQAKREEKTAAAAINSRTTFGEFARAHIAANIAPGFRGAKTAKDWVRSIEIHCKPMMGKRPSDITMADVEDCLRPIWHSRPRPRPSFGAVWNACSTPPRSRGFVRRATTRRDGAANSARFCRSRSAARSITRRPTSGTSPPSSPSCGPMFPNSTCRGWRWNSPS